MADHIAAVSRACFYQLRQLRTIRTCLTPETTRTLVQAFIGSGLDYCNSLLVGISAQLLQRLQVIQKAAARLVTGARKYDHISPTLRELHWLPVRKRITFKLAVLVFKCLHGLAPPYLATYCTRTSSTAGHLTKKFPSPLLCFYFSHLSKHNFTSVTHSRINSNVVQIIRDVKCDV